jgi:hypothetical protein
MDDVARLAGVSHQIVSRVLMSTSGSRRRPAPGCRPRSTRLLISVAPVLIFYAFMSRIVRKGMNAGPFR